jgi:hypothetical protein
VTESKVTVDELDARYVLENSVMIGPGVSLPERFVARVSEDEFDVEVEIHANVLGAKAHRVSITDKSPNGIQATYLRRVPIASIVKKAARQVVWMGDGLGGGVIGPQLEEVPDEIRRQWPNGDLYVFLRHVAAIYLIADALGDGPTAAIAAAFGVSRATAGRYVEAARKDKLLPPVLKATAEPFDDDDKERWRKILGRSIEDEDEHSWDGMIRLGYANGEEYREWMEEPFSGWSVDAIEKGEDDG